MAILLDLALETYDRMIGLDLADLSIDCCITKVPCGGEVASRLWPTCLLSARSWRQIPSPSCLLEPGPAIPGKGTFPSPNLPSREEGVPALRCRYQAGVRTPSDSARGVPGAGRPTPMWARLASKRSLYGSAVANPPRPNQPGAPSTTPVQCGWACVAALRLPDTRKPRRMPGLLSASVIPRRFSGDDHLGCTAGAQGAGHA
jgi:hypothetical protein